MWISDKWKDFEVLDCSDGEKLERWGEHVLVRPDPQVIWNTHRRNKAWGNFSAKYSRSNSGGGAWDRRKVPEQWQIKYGELTFNVKPMNFKHTGIFPEQATNWDFAMDKIKNAGREISVLNLFGYTGAATLACAAAGATVCHVDAARGMVQWARENAASSGLSEKPIRWIVDDCVKFVEREIRRGRRYDAVIMDPPSYGRGPQGEIWKLEENLWGFLELVSEVMTDEPLFAIINSYTTGLSPSVLTYMSQSIFARKFGGRSESQELGLPVKDSGLYLPCGATCRFIGGADSWK